MVYEALSGVGDLERKRIEEALARMDQRILGRVSDWDPALGWLSNAEAEHKRRPFHAIVARANPNRNSAVLEVDDIDETNPLWKCRTEITVPRVARDMADAVGSLLRIGREIVFVDPYFSPDKPRYRNSLREFLCIVLADRIQVQPTRIEVHTSDRLGADWFADECKRLLPPLIPRGLSVRFVQWRQRQSGEKLHNRYILTDIGGVSFHSGLDEGEPGETDEISLMDAEAYRFRYDQYAGGSPAFDLVGDVVVQGAKE